MARAKRRRRKRGGVMMGMRGGFKKVAGSVTGKGDTSGKSSWLGTALTVLLLAAAVGFVLYRMN
jgi:hypothetical protein